MNMKTIRKMLLLAIIFCGVTQYTEAQEKHGKLEVTTQLTELQGNYDQRKFYRELLTYNMKNCPYISHFSVNEANESQDNHNIIWHYEVNKRDDITKFYKWLYNFLLSPQENDMKTSLTPFGPHYNLSDKTEIKERIS